MSNKGTEEGFHSLVVEALSDPRSPWYRKLEDQASCLIVLQPNGNWNRTTDDRDGGGQGEPDPLKQMGLLPDHANKNKHLVKPQINDAELVSRDDMSFSRISRCLFMSTARPDVTWRRRRARGYLGL